MVVKCGLICWASQFTDSSVASGITLRSHSLYSIGSNASVHRFISFPTLLIAASLHQSAKNLPDWISDFIIMDEQTLHADQMNTNTFSDLSVCLMGLALNDVQNETTCEERWKTTASFLILLHNMLFFYSTCFVLIISLLIQRWVQTRWVMKATSDAVQTCLSSKCKIPR